MEIRIVESIVDSIRWVIVASNTEIRTINIVIFDAATGVEIFSIAIIPFEVVFKEIGKPHVGAKSET